MGEIIEFPSNGSTGSGYIALPHSGGGPGVLVVQEWWGLLPQITRVCDRLAAEGFVALAPDLYHGKQVPLTEPDEAAKEMMAMDMSRAANDLSGAVDELIRRSSSDKAAVVGFCMGGGLALVLACRRPESLNAVVPFYGVIPWPDAQPDYSRIQAPVLGHFAELDSFFTPDLARKLETELKGLGKDAEFHIYEGVDHAFFNEDRPEVYNPDAAQMAWQRTLAFLRRTRA